MEDTMNPPGGSRLSAALRSVEASARIEQQDKPFEQTQQFHDMLAAAHEFLLNRIEDQRLDIGSWAKETVVKYV